MIAVQEYNIITFGKVAFLFSPAMSRRWRDGGAQLCSNLTGNVDASTAQTVVSCWFLHPRGTIILSKHMSDDRFLT